MFADLFNVFLQDDFTALFFYLQKGDKLRFISDDNLMVRAKCNHEICLLNCGVNCLLCYTVECF